MTDLTIDIPGRRIPRHYWPEETGPRSMTHNEFFRYCAQSMLDNAVDEQGDRGLNPWFSSAQLHHDMLFQSFAAYHDAMHAVRGNNEPERVFTDIENLIDVYLDYTNNINANPGEGHARVPTCCAMTLGPISDLVYGTWEEDIDCSEHVEHYGNHNINCNHQPFDNTIDEAISEPGTD